MSTIDIAEVRRRLDGFRRAIDERHAAAEVFPPVRGGARARYDENVNQATFAAFVVAAQIVTDFVAPLLDEVDELRRRVALGAVPSGELRWGVRIGDGAHVYELSGEAEARTYVAQATDRRLMRRVATSWDEVDE